MSVSGLGKIIPMMGWLPSYRKEWLRFDLVAGLTAATVIIPKAMAYAAIAGLPLVVGLYTSLVMLVVYAVLGTSRLLSVTTSSTIAILAASALGAVAPGGEVAILMSASATLSLLVGTFLLLGGLLRLGILANLISDPVLTGFKAGIGMVIVLDQAPKLLDVHIAKAGFFQDIVSIIKHLPETSFPTLILALAMLALLLGLKHFTPRLPASLTTVAVGIALSGLAGLDRWGISLVGTVQAGLPSFALPDLNLAQQLWPAALGIALMSFVETAAAGRAFIHEGDLPPEGNHELVATGLANLAGAFFHSMPGGGGTSQTAVKPGRRRPHPDLGIGDRSGDHGDSALSRSFLRTDTQCHPGCRRYHRQCRPGQPVRVPSYPLYQNHGVSLGPHRRFRGDGVRNPGWTPDSGVGDDSVADRSRQQSSHPYTGSQTGNKDLPPQLSRAPSGRNLSGTFASSPGRSNILCQCPAAWSEYTVSYRRVQSPGPDSALERRALHGIHRTHDADQIGRAAQQGRDRDIAGGDESVRSGGNQAIAALEAIGE